MINVIRRIGSWPAPFRWAAAVVLTVAVVAAIPFAALAGALVSAKRREDQEES